MKRRVNQVLRGAVLALTAATFAAEFRTPAEQRTWHGHLFGRIPYDWRLPTLQRIRDRWWNPGEPRLFTDRAFGVGWDLNLYRLRQLALGR